MNEGSVPRSYIITWRASNNGSTFTCEANMTSTILTNLQPNTSYDVSIIARNDAGSGESSEFKRLRTG